VTQDFVITLSIYDLLPLLPVDKDCSVIQNCKPNLIHGILLASND